MRVGRVDGVRHHELGGIRADLTCPTTDTPSDFCPAYTPPAPPPFNITKGQVFTVLPFGNFLGDGDLTGAELKSQLENGVSSMPSQRTIPAGLGLCFDYNIEAPVGSRVIANTVVRQAADGSCTGALVDLSATATYMVALNDFIALGGDGYLNLLGRFASRGVTLDEVVREWIAATTPITPVYQDRVFCTDQDEGSGNACPAFAPCGHEGSVSSAPPVEGCRLPRRRCVVGTPAAAHEGAPPIALEPGRRVPWAPLRSRLEDRSSNETLRVFLVGTTGRADLGSVVTDGEGHRDAGHPASHRPAVGSLRDRRGRRAGLAHRRVAHRRGHADRPGRDGARRSRRGGQPPRTAPTRLAAVPRRTDC